MKSLLPSKLLSCGLVVAIVSGSASASNFTVAGTEYSLSSVYGFYENQSLLQSQPWWGNSSLTENFVNAAAGAGNPQSWFAFGNDGMVLIGYYVNGLGAFTGTGWGEELANSNNFSVVTQLASRPDINSGTILLTDIGSAVNPVFNGGTLTLQSGDQSTRNFTLNGAGGALMAPSSGSANLSGVFSGAGPLTILGSGSIALSGNNTYTGGTKIGGGTLMISNNSNLGAASGALTLDGGKLNTTATMVTQRDIAIASASTLQTDANTVLTSTGTLSGSGDLTKAGEGRWVINSASTNTGNVSVTAGTLSVGASDDYISARLNGSISVAQGARLTGHGSVGGIGNTLSNAGTVAPGGSIGTLTVSGNYVQTSAGTLSISLNPTATSLIAVSGTANIAGALEIDAESGAYQQRRYTILSSSGLSGRFTQLNSNIGSYTSASYYLSYDANNVYFNLAPSADETMASLKPNVQALQGIYAMRSAVLNNSLAYDCTVFDRKGLCIAAGNSYLQAGSERPETVNGLLIGAYRISDHLRIGAYLDQALGTSRQAGVSLASRHPTFGGFATWSAKNDETGPEIRVAASSGSNPLNIVRTVAGSYGETSIGNTELHGSAVSATLSYSVPLAQRWTLSPYLGVRRTELRTDAYVEQTASDGLSIGAVSQTSTAAATGLRIMGKLTPIVRWTGSVGVEQNLRTHSSNYVATSTYIPELMPIAFDSQQRQRRVTASSGFDIAIARNQRIGIHTTYRREPFQSANTFAALVSYQAGF